MAKWPPGTRQVLFLSIPPVTVRSVDFCPPYKFIVFVNELIMKKK